VWPNKRFFVLLPIKKEDELLLRYKNISISNNKIHPFLSLSLILTITFDLGPKQQSPSLSLAFSPTHL
jgi:hypothetical protein